MRDVDRGEGWEWFPFELSGRGVEGKCRRPFAAIVWWVIGGASPWRGLVGRTFTRGRSILLYVSVLFHRVCGVEQGNLVQVGLLVFSQF